VRYPTIAIVWERGTLDRKAREFGLSWSEMIRLAIRKLSDKE
jgi:hypothetical protein